MDRVLTILDDLGARRHSQNLAEEYRDKALAEVAGSNVLQPVASSLREVGHFPVQRES